MLTTLIVIALVIGYAMVGMFAGGYALAVNRADETSFWDKPDDPPIILCGVFWPLVVPLFLLLKMGKPCANIGARLHGLQVSLQEKREVVKLQKSIEQKKTRIELKKIEEELDEELATSGSYSRRHANARD